MKPVVVKGAVPPKKKPGPGSPDPNTPDAQAPPKPVVPKQKSIFNRITEIVADDVHYYIHGIRSKDRDKWEDYKKFCELSRKKK